MIDFNNDFVKRVVEQLGVVVELPDGDQRKVKIWWKGLMEGKMHICITIEDNDNTEQHD